MGDLGYRCRLRPWGVVDLPAHAMSHSKQSTMPLLTQRLGQGIGPASKSGIRLWSRHVLLRNRSIYGIRSTIAVRSARCFSERRHCGEQHMPGGETDRTKESTHKRSVASNSLEMRFCLGIWKLKSYSYTTAFAIFEGLWEVMNPSYPLHPRIYSK